MVRELISRARAVMGGLMRPRGVNAGAADQSDREGEFTDLDVNSPREAFDILRHNVRVVRKERLSRRVPPHQRSLPQEAPTQSG